ncbi:rhomboid family intramembrane serine protease [Microbacterium sp. P06]|uniref:rhomboid family intramembrane serine protease n=1 Tax=unclassified Microbacterium TaxID=2609290 RepID=UPI003744E5ED
MTTDDFRRNRDNFCYRHPDRQSFVLCQRCMRTICPECQTQAAVGVICPECMAEQRKAQTPVQKKAERRWARRPQVVAAASSGRPVVTLTIIAITALVYVITLIPGYGPAIEAALAYNSVFVTPAYGFGIEPWRLLTTALVHGNFLHIALNMLTLWVLGRSLEPLLGTWRFLALYLISALGGSVAVTLLSPLTTVVGASGAIFGMFGALLVIGRHIGADIRAIAVLIGINFAFPFVFALINSIGSGSFAASLDAVGISWQAHLGGLVVGALVGFVYAQTRTVKRRPLQIGMLIGLSVVLVALLAVPTLVG